MPNNIEPRFGRANNVDNSQAQPFDPSRGDGCMTLAQLFGSDIVKAVETEGKLVFQATGDTGVDNQNQRDVVLAMSRDLDPHQREKGPPLLPKPRGCYL